MNERIKELWDRAAKSTAAFPSGQNNSWETQVNFMEKFAELIVRECVKEMSQQMYWHRIDQSNNSNFYKAVEKTLKHFGVEE